nr:187-kDa microtubule-associated protein AIR9 isoform X1 [Tanacetum cinerariifolium]
MTDTFGRSSDPAYVETDPISPGFPKIEKLEIEGRGFHTNLYAVRGNYIGGKEGKSKIQWLRSMLGSPDLISLPGETGRMYEANVDDVGYRLVAIYTPIREDGVEGFFEPDVNKEVKQKLELGSVKFETLCDKDRSSKKVNGVGSLERRVLEVNRKRVKVVKPGSKISLTTTDIRGSYAPPFHVETFGNDQHRLKIVVDSDSELDLMVQTRHLRDVIVLVIRGFAQKFNSTSLNSLLKIDA